MTKKEKMKKWVRENKDLIVGVGCLAASAIGIVHVIRQFKEGPYPHLMWYNDKAYRDDMHGWVSWAGGHYDGGEIGWGLTADEVTNAVERTFGDEPNKNLYRLIIHKVAKSNIET